MLHGSPPSGAGFITFFSERGETDDVTTDTDRFFAAPNKVGSVSVTGKEAQSILSCGDRCARESVRTRPGSEDSNRTTCICDALLVAV